jgi:hypothetical protein
MVLSELGYLDRWWNRWRHGSNFTLGVQKRRGVVTLISSMPGKPQHNASVPYAAIQDVETISAKSLHVAQKPHVFAQLNSMLCWLLAGLVVPAPSDSRTQS